MRSRASATAAVIAKSAGSRGRRRKVSASAPSSASSAERGAVAAGVELGGAVGEAQPEVGAGGEVRGGGVGLERDGRDAWPR